MADRVEFTVYGKPQPAGSKKAIPIKKGGQFTGRIAVIEDAKARVRPWQALIKDAALEALGGERQLAGPVFLDVDFYLARPAGHYGSGRNREIVKSSAPRFPTTRPDITKLLRGLEDALTGIVWADDAQVVSQRASKRYGLPERVEVIAQLAPVDLGEVRARVEQLAGQTDIYEHLFEEER